MRLIYLGSPYFSNSKDIMDVRVRHAEHCMAHFRRTASEVVVYSPIVQWSSVAHNHELPHDFDSWAQQDFFMIRKASAIWVLTISGWKESYGLSQELEYAADIGKPVMYIIPEEQSTNYVLTSDRPE